MRAIRFFSRRTMDAWCTQPWNLCAKWTVWCNEDWQGFLDSGSQGPRILDWILDQIVSPQHDLETLHKETPWLLKIALHRTIFPQQHPSIMYGLSLSFRHSHKPTSWTCINIWRWSPSKLIQFCMCTPRYKLTSAQRPLDWHYQL